MIQLALTVLIVVLAAVLGLRALRPFRGDHRRPPFDADDDPEARVRQQFHRRRMDEQRRAVDEARARAAKRDS